MLTENQKFILAIFQNNPQMVYGILKNPDYINQVKKMMSAQGFSQQQISQEMSFIESMTLEKLKAELANENSPFTISLVVNSEKSFAQGFKQGFQQGIQQPNAETKFYHFAGRSNPGQEGKLNGFTLYYHSNQTYRGRAMNAEIAKDAQPADVSNPLRR